MSYNGYPSWAQWNVSLWINNDEGLYNMALESRRAAKVASTTKLVAAEFMLDSLHEMGLTHTPDGAKYTVTAIKRAMVGM